MKKIIYILLITTVLIIPFNTNAASIKSTVIEGTNKVTIGQEFTLSFKINLEGIMKSDSSSLGVWLAMFELEYDRDAFVVTNITSQSKEWNSVLLEEAGKTYVLSEVNEENNTQNMCNNGVLYCADYIVSVHFYVKNTDVSTSTIKMGEVEVGLLDMVNEEKTYTMDDLITLNQVSKETREIQIIKPEVIPEATQEPEGIKPTEKSVETEMKVEKKPNSTQSESTSKPQKTLSQNNYLKDLRIENHPIKFDKNKNEYTINIDNETNQLNIEAIKEDELSEVVIVGNDDLKSNGYKISIEVTAENGEKNTYTIHAKIKEEIVQKNSEDSKKTPKFKIDKKYLIMGGSVIAVISIISGIISFINGRKIDKQLDRF